MTSTSGINESKLLRWLIRNRQEKGIEKRYQIEQRKPPAPPAPTSTAPSPAASAPQGDKTVPAVTSSAAATTTSGPPPE